MNLEQYQKYIWLSLFCFSVLVLFLAHAWAPFGKPLPLWNYINIPFLAVFGCLTLYYYNKEDEQNAEDKSSA